MNCVFCNIDKSRPENTIIDESDNFIVLPAVGSLVDGYLMIVSKKHINSMSELKENEIKEYEFLIEKYRNKFKNIYNKFPIIFEHGTPIKDSDMKASSVVHAHTHIVNHQFFDESAIIKNLNFDRIDNLNYLSKEKNYIMYINPKNNCYVSYNFEPVSQIMRKIIAKDLGYENKFDWKKEKFIENINSTIRKFTKGSDKNE